MAPSLIYESSLNNLLETGPEHVLHSRLHFAPNFNSILFNLVSLSAVGNSLFAQILLLPDPDFSVR